MSADGQFSMSPGDVRARINGELERAGLQQAGDKVDYMVEKVQPVMSQMLHGVLLSRPPDVALFFLSWLVDHCQVPGVKAADLRNWILSKDPSSLAQASERLQSILSGEPPAGQTSGGVGSFKVGFNQEDHDSDHDHDHARDSVVSQRDSQHDDVDGGEGELSQPPASMRSSIKKSSTTGSQSTTAKKGRRISFWKAAAPDPEKEEKKGVGFDGVDDEEVDQCPWQMRAKKKPAKKEEGTGSKGTGSNNTFQKQDSSQVHQQRQMKRRFTVSFKVMNMNMPPMERCLELLRPVPAFSHLSEDQLRVLIPHFECKQFENEEDVATYGQPLEYLHIVADGKGRVCVPQQFAAVEPGSFFGEEAMKSVGYPWTKTVTAMGAITTICLKGDVFEELGMQKSKMEKSNKKIANRKTNADPSGHRSSQPEACGMVTGSGLEIIRNETLPKTEEEKHVIRAAVRANKALTDVLQLSEEQLDYLISAMYLVRVPNGVALTRMGDPGNTFYVINQGVFEVCLGENKKRSDSDSASTIRLRMGDSFGELALLYDSPRAATIKAAQDCEAWVLTRASFKIIMRMAYTQRLAQYQELIQNIEIFKNLGESEMDMVADTLEEVHFDIDEEIVAEGEEADGFFVVFEGECEILREGENVGTINKGDYFGERALCSSKAKNEHDMTVRALSETVTLLFIDKLTFQMVAKTVDDINKQRASTTSQNMKLNAHGSTGLSRLSPAAGEQVKRFSVACEAAGQATPQYMDHIDKQKHLHEVYTQKRVSHMNHKIEASRGVGGMVNQLKKSKEGEDQDQIKEEDELNLEDLEAIGKLGEGSFGYVLLVKDRGNDKYIGLKAMVKDRIHKEGLVEMIKNERSCQLSVTSKFVVRLYSTYQNDTHVFMALEPCLGGELFDVYNNENFFKSVKHAKFYIACCSLALEAIHSKRIIYRDLKLENCLLNGTGYCKLTDMGLAKMILGKTYTVCGTADYFAPETLKQTGHNRAVDWWAIGVLLFTMMAGRSPFDAEDVIQIYKNIVKGFSKVKFPKGFDMDIIDCIKSLCRKKPEERITMQKGGVQNLKDHIWFGTFSWDDLEDFKMEAPFIPHIPDNDEISKRPRSDNIDIMDLQDWDGSFEEAN